MTDSDAKPQRPRRAIRFINLPLGLLPIVAGGLVLGAIAYQKTQPLKPHYEQRALELLKARKFAEAQACIKRLLAFEPDSAEVRFALARTHEALGQVAAAEEIIRSLAPRGQEGFLPAQFWLAQRLSATAPSVPEHAKEAEERLLFLLKAHPKSAAIKVALGQLFVRTGQASKALLYLIDVASGNPRILLSVAQCYVKLGDEAAAARYRREAVEASQTIAEKNPDAPGARLHWSQATAASGDYAKALEILDKDAAETGPDAFDVARAALCEEWSTVILADAKRPSAERLTEALRVIKIGLENDPSSEGLESKLTGLMLLAGLPGEEARASMTRVAEAGSPPGLAAAARLSLGNVAVTNKRLEEARKHWSAGFALRPDLPVLANNHAWALAHIGEPDPARALTVIEQALKTRELDPRLRGTRGLILLKLGRAQDARTDLERALAAGYAHPELKAALSDLGGAPTGRSGSNKPGPSAPVSVPAGGG